MFELAARFPPNLISCESRPVYQLGENGGDLIRAERPVLSQVITERNGPFNAMALG